MCTDAIIPARNEARTVAGVVQGLRAHLPVNRVIVIDNGSSDATASRAREAGAEVYECRDVGLGHAMLLGLSLSDADRVLRTDADIADVDFRRLLALIETRADLARGIFDSSYDSFPVTRLVVEPLLGLLEPTLKLPPLPLSGTYAFTRTSALAMTWPTDWAFDLALLLHALKSGLNIANVDIGRLVDTPRTIEHYVPMATDIIRFLLSGSAHG
jgi:glucosyl-3-phosphoglycerate synthase